MAERSLRVVRTDKNFFSKITNTITKMLIPTKVGLNGMLISVKRNALLKAYENFANISAKEEDKKEILEKKYEDAYALYLESIDKYVMDSIYKRVKARVATSFEEEALSKYYNVISLKDTQYLEYKYRKQKYLLELDFETVDTSKKTRLYVRYKNFYWSKMDILYKGILKHYSVQLADHLKSSTSKRDCIYKKIFETLDEYVINILTIKVEYSPKNCKSIMEDFDRYNTFLAGKLDRRDNLEKQLILLSISRSIFTHSLPLVVAEQCYIKLLKETRDLIVTSPNSKKQKEAFELLFSIIDEFNKKLLATKIYWDKPEQRKEYKEFWEAYKKIQDKKEKESEEYQKEREIILIKNDLKAVNGRSDKYSKIIKIYKEKLVAAGVMKQYKDSCKTKEGKWIKKIKVEKPKKRGRKKKVVVAEA